MSKIMIIFSASLAARIFLIIIFVMAGVAKLSNQDKTRIMLAEFGVNSHFLSFASWALPLAELAIAAALAFPPIAFAGAWLATAVLTLFTAVIIAKLTRGQRPSCNCFGVLGSSPIGPATLVRNVLLTLLALLVVVAGPDAAATWRLDRVLGMSPFETLVGMSAVVTILLLVVIAALQVVILNRLNTSGPDGPEGISHTLPTASRGLPEGTLAPRFGLADSRGEFVTLDELLAARRPLILLFTKPDCPPCVAMSSEVERWQRIHANHLTIMRIGESGSAAEHYTLMQVRGEVAAAYDCWGTPCAVLVMPDGTIGSPTAQGSAAIRALVKRTAAAAG